MSHNPSIGDILRSLDRIFPFENVAPWDNVGLLAGKKGKIVRKVLVGVDVTPEFISQAVASRCDLLLTHHPLFVEPMKKVNDSTPEGALLIEILKNGLSLISSHTNADIAPGGVSYLLADALGLENIRPLKVVHTSKFVKIVVFTPSSHVESVLSTAFNRGGGIIGDYSSCSFRVSGTGTFTPQEMSKPFSGVKGKINAVKEERVEFIVPDENKNEVISEVRKTHPYEKPAIDVYPLENSIPDGWLGARGELAEEKSLGEFLGDLNSSVTPSIIRFSGSLDEKVKKIGVLGGSGGNYVNDAAMTDIDLFVSGDLKHHQVHRLKMGGKIAVDMGHYDSEKLIMNEFKRILLDEFGKVLSVDIYGESTEFMRVFSG